MLQDLKIKYFDEEIDIYNEHDIVNKKTNTIMLDKIPSERGIYVKYKNKELTEVQSNPSQYEFVADRETSTLLFNPIMSGKEVEIDYSAIGKFCMSSDKVYTNVDDKGNIIQTLDELLVENHKILESVKTVGDGATVITQLQANIDSVVGLTGSIAEGSTVNDKLIKTTNTAKATDITLNDTVISANSKLNDLNTWVDNHGNIVDLDNRVESVETSIPEINSQLDTRVKENDFLKLVDNVYLLKNDTASKDYVNTKIESIGSNRNFKGSCLYSELPTSATVDDYWFVSDRKSNYCWNGTNWIDIGNDLNIGINSIGLKNLDVDIREDIGDYREVNGILTINQAYYPKNKVATSFETTKWSNIIIDNLSVGSVLRVTLSYINSDEMYGIIFVDDEWNVISTDLKGTDIQENVRDYRIITPKLATKVILNCYEPNLNEFKVTKLNYEKIATIKHVEEISITKNELGKIYVIGTNKINSEQYENKKFVDVFPDDSTYIDIPISEYANIGDGIGYRFNIWFTDGTTITGSAKASYLDEAGKEITWFAYGNPVTSSYPITGAKTIRAYAISKIKNPEVVSKTIKGFTFSKEILTDYVTFISNTNYEKIEEISTEKAKQVFDEKSQEIDDKILMLPSTNYNTVIKSINRIGYDVYNSNTPPEQSIESFKLAYKKGFRTLLCDLRFTKDNIPVCIHDATINSVARNADGTTLSETITVAEKTLEELNSYDFGIKKGDKYKGTKILTLDEMCKLIKNLGVELYIEIKDTLQNEDEKIKAAVSIVRKYKLNNVSWAHDNVTKFGNFTKIAQEYRVATMHGEMNSTRINELLSLKTPQNSLFWFSWDTSPLPIEIVNLMQENNIEFEVGTIDSESDLFSWFNANGLRQYCTGISSNKIVAGKVILENELI